MHIRDLNGKKICIVGLGREGGATLHALERHAPDAKITVADNDPHVKVTRYETQLGKNYLENLDRFDVVIKSPGIPPHSQFSILNSTLTSATQIFLDSIAETGASVIGVTGSKGKSTTTSLIYEILKSAGEDVHLVGNIGHPALDALEDAREGTTFVMELSSYQLMDLTASPHIAVVTAFFPEHLDYHGSLEAYHAAKKNITKHQSREDIVLYNADSEGSKAIADESAGKKIAFTSADAPVKIADTNLIGVHNLSNIAAAYKTCTQLGVPDSIMIDTIKTFKGLPHRLQNIGEYHGIIWIDDAISTTPESTIAAIDALDEKLETIVLGGRDRGYDFAALGKRIAGSSIKNVILFPESGPRIKQAIENTSAHVDFYHASSMKDAVEIAKKKTKGGSICLLSTASPSYGLFKNFEDKGEQFKKYVMHGWK